MLPQVTVNHGVTEVRLNVERDYCKLVAFQLALEKIVELARDTWSFSADEAASLAQHALTMFGEDD